MWSCDLIVKVKELQPREYAMLRRASIGIDQGGIAETSRMTSLSAAGLVISRTNTTATPALRAASTRTCAFSSAASGAAAHRTGRDFLR